MANLAAEQATNTDTLFNNLCFNTPLAMLRTETNWVVESTFGAVRFSAIFSGSGFGPTGGVTTYPTSGTIASIILTRDDTTVAITGLSVAAATAAPLLAGTQGISLAALLFGGADTLTGGEGNDTLHGHLGDDLPWGGAGNDFLRRLDGDDTLLGSTGNDRFEGGAGKDLADFSAAAAPIVTRLQTFSGSGATVDLFDVERVTGSAFGDTLIGAAAAESLRGGEGNDLVEGGAGDDTLAGEAGQDTARYVGASAGVAVSLAILTAQATGGAGTDLLSGFENLTGSAFADTLTGDAGDNVIEGGAGNDRLEGGAGRDTLSYVGASFRVDVTLISGVITVGSFGADTVSGFEDLRGGAGGDSLTGNAGANRIEGMAGADTLSSAAGSDTLEGGHGNDTLLGGADEYLAGYAAAASGIVLSLAIGAGRVVAGLGTLVLSGIKHLRGSALGADRLQGNALVAAAIPCGARRAPIRWRAARRPTACSAAMATMCCVAARAMTG